MNSKMFALVGGLMIGTSGFALAQVTPPIQTSPNVQLPGQVQTSRLIGTNVQNFQNQTIGEINSVALGADGQVDAVIVGVGGFLGVGEREVALNWRDLTISDGGAKVAVNMSKDQLAGLPAYRFVNNADRGTAFRTLAQRDTSPMTAPAARVVVAPRAGDPVLAQATPAIQSAPNVQMPGQMQASQLLGTNIQNLQNETIGEVKSVALGADGTVDAVIVGVGGFLGVGEREVALNWRDLRITDNGAKVTVNMTKDQLSAMPAYRYADNTARGTIFRGVLQPTPTPRVADAVRDPLPRTNDVGLVPAGFMTASKLVGLNLYDPQNKSVGEIKDVVLGGAGDVQRAIINVGGVMGIGSKDVGIAWSDIKFRTDGDDLKAIVGMSTDQLKALPEYRNERGAWVLKN